MSNSESELKTCYITDGTLSHNCISMDEEKKMVVDKWKWLSDKEEGIDCMQLSGALRITMQF